MPFEPSETVSRKFFDYLVNSHTLGHDGFHGRDHWLRVLHNARAIATETEANLRVMELFAVLHDSQRQNENHDPDHGHRAAAYAAVLRGKWFDLADDEMELLIEACRYHSDGIAEAYPTVQACWDSDRLDLGRVGVRPDPRFLCTSFAKRPDVIEAAYLRSTQGLLMHAQDFVELTACWGNDDADSTIKISTKKWEEINAGAQFQKTAKSCYEGQKYDITWSFSNGVVSIDGEDGMQCVVDLPVGELILHQLKPGGAT